LRIADFQFETPHVVSYISFQGITISAAVLGATCPASFASMICIFNVLPAGNIRGQSLICGCHKDSQVSRDDGNKNPNGCQAGNQNNGGIASPKVLYLHVSLRFGFLE